MPERLSRRAALKAGMLAPLLLSACSPAARLMHTQARTTPPYPARLRRLMERVGYGPVDGLPTDDYTTYLDQHLDPVAIDDRVCDLLIRNLHLYHKGYGQLHFHDHADIERELVTATLIRKVRSRRHVYEAMVEFWSDHFAIYTGKDKVMPRLKLIDDREVIRPHALGRFPDLLRASATSPAMLAYLDNVTNYAAHPNENYARELLELHTVGIDGGYTQLDVQELARALTGWTVHQEGIKEGQWTFDESVHDPAEKTVMGHHIPAGSGPDGVRGLLDDLALHPATANHISRKLVARFVADDPPPALVKKAARTFLTTQGDIRAVLRVILLDDAFFSAPPKIKRPMSFVASLLRGTGADIAPRGYGQIGDRLRQMGHRPFDWPMPDGYPHHTDAWLGTLLTRWNTSITLFSGQVEDINLPDLDPEALSHRLIGAPLPPPLAAYHQQGGPAAHTLALLTMTPAFNWS